jgi:hypothetical protein
MDDVVISEWTSMDVALERMQRAGRVVVLGDAVSSESHMRVIYAKHGWPEVEELAVEWRSVVGHPVESRRGRKS